jgi:hypothetical protein
MAGISSVPTQNLRNNGWLSVPWAHLTTGHGASDGTDGALGHGSDGNQMVFPIIVRFDDVQQAITELCGLYVFNPVTGYLNRTLPKQHPAFKWVYVKRVTSIKPMKWTAKGLYLLGNWSVYDYCLLTVLFHQPHYPMLSDAYLDARFPPFDPDGSGTVVRQEWLRFCQKLPMISTELLTIDVGSLKYAEGGGTGPAIGTLLQVPTAQPIPVGDFILVQHQVPIYGLYSPTTYRAENLIAATGKVNSATFLGYPAGTLLYQGPQFQDNEAPYPADQMAFYLNAASGNFSVEQLWPSLTCTVSHVFKYRDPPAGGATRGWNLQPFRGDMKWYLATVDGLTTGAAALLTTDFRKMFRYAA